MERETKHVFTWTIENFKLCTLKNGHALTSPVFVAENLLETSWYVELFPEGFKKSTSGFISCYLQRSNDCSGPDEVECDYIIEAIGGNNQSLRKYQYKSKFQKGRALGWEEFLKKESISETNTGFSRDTLTIQVTFIKRLPKILTQNNCCTKIASGHSSFMWNVESSISSNEQVKCVSVSENSKFDITLRIPADDLEICIRRKKGFIESEKLLCRVALLDLESEETDFKEAILESDHPNEKDAWKFPNFLKISEIIWDQDRHIKENYFTLKFDFVLSNGKTSESFRDIECKALDQSLKVKEGQYASLVTDLKRAFTNHAHADVELHADNKIIRAHKVILCARSPVFSAMFDQNMAENLSGVVNVSDIEYVTLNSLLEYMYTAEVAILDCKSTLKLLLAADMYQVLSLKEKCFSFLESVMSDENVCNILFTADLIQEKSLKVCAVNHIKKHSKKIFKSDEWKHLAENNLKLATEIFCEVSTPSS